MFDLKIQSSQPPRDKTVMGRKICSGLKLVNGPLVFNGQAALIFSNKGGAFDRMGQLEYDAEYKPRKQTKGQKPPKPIAYPYQIYRQYDKDKQVNELEAPEADVITYCHRLERNGSNAAGKVFFVVSEKDPPQIQQ
jgi:hypothetical protein